MKLGISLKIDVKKLEKARFFHGKNGAVYADITTFVDLDNPDNYGNHGFITQNVSKEERANGVKGPIVGNTKVFYNDSHSQQQKQPQGFQQHPNQTGGFQQVQSQGFTPQQPEPQQDFDDDIPF